MLKQQVLHLQIKLEKKGESEETLKKSYSLLIEAIEHLSQTFFVNNTVKQSNAANFRELLEKNIWPVFENAESLIGREKMIDLKATLSQIKEISESNFPDTESIVAETDTKEEEKYSDSNTGEDESPLELICSNSTQKECNFAKKDNQQPIVINEDGDELKNIFNSSIDPREKAEGFKAFVEKNGYIEESEVTNNKVDQSISGLNLYSKANDDILFSGMKNIEESKAYFEDSDSSSEEEQDNISENVFYERSSLISNKNDNKSRSRKKNEKELRKRDMSKSFDRGKSKKKTKSRTKNTINQKVKLKISKLNKDIKKSLLKSVLKKSGLKSDKSTKTLNNSKIKILKDKIKIKDSSFMEGKSERKGKKIRLKRKKDKSTLKKETNKSMLKSEKSFVRKTPKETNRSILKSEKSFISKTHKETKEKTKKRQKKAKTPIKNKKPKTPKPINILQSEPLPTEFRKSNVRQNINNKVFLQQLQNRQSQIKNNAFPHININISKRSKSKLRIKESRNEKNEKILTIQFDSDQEEFLQESFNINTSKSNLSRKSRNSNRKSLSTSNNSDVISRKHQRAQKQY